MLLRRLLCALVLLPTLLPIYLGVDLSSAVQAASVNGAWTQLSPAGQLPPVRGHHAAVWDPNQNQMLVFGGEVSSSNRFNDLWSYKPATNTWIQLTPAGAAPPVHAAPAAVWNSTNNQMLVFGGGSTSGYVNDLWAYGSATNTWTMFTPSSSVPPARDNHAAVWDPTNNQMLVFGGFSFTFLGDLWSFKPGNNSWSQIAPTGSVPGTRAAHTAIWDPIGNQMLVYGGYNGSFLSDLWSYKPTSNTWTQISPSGQVPPSRRDHTAIWDSAGQRMLISGGYNPGVLSDLWSYTPADNTWRQLTSAPTTFIWHSAVWDPTKNQMLTFGGGLTFVNDLWSYSASGNLNLQVTVTTSGRFIAAEVQDTASLPIRVQITDSASGSPVPGAPVVLSNGNTSLGTTNSSGLLETSILIPNALTPGDFISEVVSTVNGRTFSSGPQTLYHVDLVGDTSNTLTDDEVKAYSLALLSDYARRPSIPCGGVPGVVIPPQICPTLKVIDFIAKALVYVPQAGDTTTIKVFKVTAQSTAPVYLYFEGATRSGASVYSRSKWTEQESWIQPYTQLLALDRTALVITFASPVTVLVVDPSGKRAGVQPSTGEFIFEMAVAISDKGDEPYSLVVPSPQTGEYQILVTGTGSGPYTMRSQSINASGQGSPPVSVVGKAVVGVTDTYIVSQSSIPGQMVNLSRQVNIDIKPGGTPNTINLGSQGTVPVAILSSSTFDATKIDPLSVMMASASVKLKGQGTPMSAFEDVNGDGLRDLVVHVTTQALQLSQADTKTVLTGRTVDGLAIRGTDSIRVAP